MATKKVEEVIFSDEDEVYFDLPRKIRYIQVMDLEIQKLETGGKNWLLMVNSRNNAAMIANQYIQFLKKREVDEQQYDSLFALILSVLGDDFLENLHLKVQKTKSPTGRFFETLEQYVALINHN